MSNLVSLSPPPILQFLNNLGQLNSGGSILTQVGGVNYPTYQDSLGNTALPNPIPLNSRGEISNASGVSCQLFLVSGVTYTFSLYDVNGNLLNEPISVTAPLAANSIPAGSIVSADFAATAMLGIVGASQNAFMELTSASATATFTADELIVETALGGTAYKLSSFNQSINVGTTGAGGMDTGSAPATGFLSIYAIYNPSNGNTALLGTNATTSSGNIYSGANMPNGYTCSALLAIVPTTAGSLIGNCTVRSRSVDTANINVLNITGNTAGSNLSISSAVPAAAKSARGVIQLTNATAATTSLNIYANSGLVGNRQLQNINYPAAGGQVSNFEDIQLTTAQQLYYTATSGAGTAMIIISINGYTF